MTIVMVMMMATERGETLSLGDETLNALRTFLGVHRSPRTRIVAGPGQEEVRFGIPLQAGQGMQLWSTEGRRPRSWAADSSSKGKWMRRERRSSERDFPWPVSTADETTTQECSACIENIMFSLMADSKEELQWGGAAEGFFLLANGAGCHAGLEV